jgi:hypothetical protein
MKLNLLPQTVSKGRQSKSAVFFSAIIAIAGLVIGGYLNVSSSKALDNARTDQQASVDPAVAAYSKSQEADTLMQQPTSVALIRDANLAQAMDDHNSVYPALYDSLFQYIPSFYRVNSMSATSAGDNANVTLVGTLDTFQQYADLMLAFSRYPGLVSISRSGFTSQDEYVPNIDQVDTQGKPRKDSDGPIPDDKLDRLAYFQQQVQQTGYTGESNYGTGTDNTRGAMPTASLVTVNLTIKKNLTTPDPRATLTAGAAGGGGAAATPSGVPGGGGPPPGVPGGGAPGAQAAGGGGTPPTAGGKKGKGDASDE